jgi:hypothetical protein
MFREIPQEACGRKDIEDALKRLDRLTQDEALMAAAQILNVTHRVDNKVTDVGNQVTGVGNQVAGVGNQVTGVGHQVTGVGNKLKDVDDKMDVVVQGMPRVEHSFTIHPILLAPPFARWKGCETGSSANVQ